MSIPQTARDKALNLLKIRPHHSVELARKLALRKYERTEIEEVIRDLKEKGLLNDDYYAEAYAGELIRNKSYGFYMLLGKLQQRGIPKAQAESLLAENFPPEKELEIAKRLAERDTRSDKMQLAQKLSHRGFRSEVIRKVIDNMAEGGGKIKA